MQTLQKVEAASTPFSLPGGRIKIKAHTSIKSSSVVTLDGILASSRSSGKTLKSPGGGSCRGRHPEVLGMQLVSWSRGLSNPLDCKQMCVRRRLFHTHRSQARRLLGEARGPGRQREMVLSAVWSRDGRRAGEEAEEETEIGGLQT